MSYTDADLRAILDNDFILNPCAFTHGRRNDDVVDSKCICFALGIDWYTNVWLNVESRYTSIDRMEIGEHCGRVDKWLKDKEANGYNRGEPNIMVYAINY